MVYLCGAEFVSSTFAEAATLYERTIFELVCTKLVAVGEQSSKSIPKSQPLCKSLTGSLSNFIYTQGFTKGGGI